MKTLLITFLSISLVAAFGQEKVNTTSSVSIEGKVKTKMMITLNDLKNYPSVSIDSVVIYNHLMEPRKTIKKITGVLLKDILGKAGFDVSSHQPLSEFYITCIASDNYKVVFSWNELYNATSGEKVMIITEANGQNAEQLPDRIAFYRREIVPRADAT